MANRDRCCCGSIDIKLGAQILAGLQVIGCVLGIIVQMLGLGIASQHSQTVWPFVIAAVLMLVHLTAAVLVFVAIRKTNYRFVLPMVGIAALGVLIMCGFFVLSMIAIFDAYSFMADYVSDFVNAAGQTVTIDIANLVRTYCIVLAVIFAIAILLYVWYFYIFFDCLRHLRDIERLRNQRRHEASHAVYAPQSAPTVIYYNQ